MQGLKLSKHSIFLLLIFLLSVSLIAGCGSESSDNTSSSTKIEQPEAPLTEKETNKEEADKVQEEKNTPAKQIEDNSINDWKVKGVSIKLPSKWERIKLEETADYVELLRVAPSNSSLTEIVLSRVKGTSPFGDINFSDLKLSTKELYKATLEETILNGDLKNYVDHNSVSLESSEITPYGIELMYSYRKLGVKQQCIAKYYIKGQYQLMLNVRTTPDRLKEVKNVMERIKIDDMSIPDWISKK